MDTVIDTPTTDIVVIDATDVAETLNDSFGKEVAKTLAISAATTAGMIAGTIAIGFAVGKFQEARARRAAKKASEPEVHVVTDMPEKPETTEK